MRTAFRLAPAGTRERLLQLVDHWIEPGTVLLASGWYGEIEPLEQMIREDEDKLRVAERNWPGEVPRIEERIKARCDRRGYVQSMLEALAEEWAEVNELARIHCPAARPELPTLVRFKHPITDDEVAEFCDRMKRALRVMFAAGTGAVEGSEVGDDAVPPASAAPDLYPFAVAIMAEAHRKEEKLTGASLARQLGISRTALYENKEHARIRQLGNDLFGLFGGEKAKGDWTGATGSKDKNRTVEAVDPDDEPVEDRARD